MPLEDNFVHLGLKWQAGRSAPNLETAISSGRRTGYKLMGAGLHGQNGLSPCISMRIVSLYILPTLLSGLEACVLKKHELNSLDRYHKKLQRMIQGLPESTATPAIYLLLGTVPLAATLHGRILSLYGNITRLVYNHPLRQLALRQIGMADSRPLSWFKQLREICTLYKIDAVDVLISPWEKLQWKAYTKNAVRNHWHRQLIHEAYGKSTLNWISLDTMGRCTPHGIWHACRMKPHLVPAATTRVRAMTGRLSLQYAPWQKDKTCTLCGEAEETTQHFIAECTKLVDIRNIIIPDLLSLYTEEGKPAPSSPYELTSACLNGDHYTLESGGRVWLEQAEDAQNLCSLIVHKLYSERDTRINEKLMI